MVTIIRTDSRNQDFIDLVRLLDADLAVRDGSEHAFYAQFNTIDKLRHVIVAYDGAVPVGCGAIKEYAPGIAEIKRMFTLPERRGTGVATTVLAGLEEWARSLSYGTCILETGKKQPEAIALYTKCGYSPIPNFGQYAGVENSVCFAKSIRQGGV